MDPNRMSGEQLIRHWRAQALKQIRGVDLPLHLGLSLEKVQLFQHMRPRFIIGADEVGRGPLAGPVTVGAFIAPSNWSLPGLKDSKLLNVAERASFAARLRSEGLGFHLAELPNDVIDRWGMVQTLQVLFEECLEQLRFRFPHEFEEALIVIDGKEQARHIDHISLPKADTLVQHVSAAAVLAKFHRDAWMATEAHSRYPQYGFDSHVGYGTVRHRKMIAKFGPCPLHRQSFLKNANAWKE